MKSLHTAAIAVAAMFSAAGALADGLGLRTIYEGRALVDLLSTHKLQWTSARGPAAEMWLSSVDTIRYQLGDITSHGPMTVDGRNALCGLDFVLPLRTWACVKLLQQPDGGFELVFFDATGRPSRSEHARLVARGAAGQ